MPIWHIWHILFLAYPFLFSLIDYNLRKYYNLYPLVSEKLRAKKGKDTSHPPSCILNNLWRHNIVKFFRWIRIEFQYRTTFKFQFVFTWEIELRIERSRWIKISLRIETRFRFMYRQSYFSGDFSTYTLKYVNKTSYFPNNLYFGHNERRFYSDFYTAVKFRFKFTWFRIDISFRIECSIRNEKWNELDPEWVATQSGFM